MALSKVQSTSTTHSYQAYSTRGTDISQYPSFSCPLIIVVIVTLLIVLDAIAISTTVTTAMLPCRNRYNSS